MIGFTVACIFWIVVYILYRFICVVYDKAGPDKHGNTKPASLSIKILYNIFRAVELIFVLICICVMAKDIGNFLKNK
jgi:hypothetical protein